jgi:uncharacterized delta-60 repeat protein
MTRLPVSDHALEALLRERAGVGAPAGLEAEIMQAIASERKHPRPAGRGDRGRLIRLLAVAAVLVTTVSAAVVIGAGRAPDRSLEVTPSVVAEPSTVVGPSVAPTSVAAPSAAASSVAAPSAAAPSAAAPSVAPLLPPVTEVPAMVIGSPGISIAIEDDGRIVVARHDGGRLWLHRFDASGGPVESSERADAIIESPISSDQTAVGLALDGTRVALYDLGDGGFELIRYRRDGSVDETFGQAGHVRSAFGDRAEPVTGTGAVGLAIGSDGAVFVFGGSVDDPDGDGQAEARLAIAKFAPDGSPFPDFGVDGRVLLDIGAGVEVVRAIAIEEGGRVVAVSETGRFMAGLDPFGVVRLTRDGTPDPAFGSEGVVLTDWCCSQHYSVATLGDGGIVVAARAGQGTGPGFGGALVRYLPDGSLDPAFGGDGLLETVIHPAAVAVQPDGRIVVASNFGGLLRYLPSGVPDPAFEGLAGWPA